MKGSVTQVLGIMAFGSQLLCELVGRGLRRMDYSNFNDQGHFKPEYVDVYGIPFSVIPFKDRSVSPRGPAMWMGKSKLNIPAAKSGTARNMNTIAKLVQMAANLSA